MDLGKNREKAGFKVPSNYFEGFEDSLVGNLETEDFPLESGFKVPDSYFDQLDQRILHHTKPLGEATRVISIFSTKNLKYAVAIAASIALLFSIANLNTSESNGFDSINTSSISEYIEDGNIAIETYDVIALLSEDELNQLQLDNQNISNDILEEYLLDNIDDTTLLTE